MDNPRPFSPWRRRVDPSTCVNFVNGFRLLIRRDADSRVADIDFQADGGGVEFHCARLEAYSSFVRELDGVGNQIHHDLPDSRLVTIEPFRQVREATVQAAIPLRRPFLRTGGPHPQGMAQDARPSDESRSAQPRSSPDPGCR